MYLLNYLCKLLLRLVVRPVIRRCVVIFIFMMEPKWSYFSFNLFFGKKRREDGDVTAKFYQPLRNNNSNELNAITILYLRFLFLFFVSLLPVALHTAFGCFCSIFAKCPKK